MSLVVLTLAVTFVSQLHAAPKPWLDDCRASQFVRFIGKPVVELEQMGPVPREGLAKVGVEARDSPIFGSSVRQNLFWNGFHLQQALRRNWI